MRKKTAIYGSARKIIYSEKRWKILEKKRERAVEVMEKLYERGLRSIVYGSVARGDVTNESDVDVFIPLRTPSYLIEIALSPFQILERRIVQATPNYAIKGEYILDNNTSVSFPLINLKDREMDFYNFGGAISLDDLRKNLRTPGVDKRLKLIKPSLEGHFEIPINDLDEIELSRVLNVSLEIIRERKRVLERRREIGRTGVFLNAIVPEDESFESFLEKIARKNPMVRRRLRE
jgi:hypothetical protein